MNPEQWNDIVRVAITVAVGPGSYLVSRGFLTTDQAAQLAPALIPTVTVLAGIITGWFHVQAHSATAMVAAVNSDIVPGVKVVSETSASPTVTVTKTGVIKTMPRTGFGT